MSEVLHTVGNVRLVRDDEPGDFPDWGDGGFQLLSYGRDRWWVSSNVDSEDLPGQQQMQNMGEIWGWYPDVIQRWLRIYYNPKATVKQYTGYSQGDYWLVVSMEGDTDTSDQIAAWAMGDVWRLAFEHRTEYQVTKEFASMAFDLDEPIFIERWIRDGGSGVTVYGDAERESQVSDLKAEMEAGDHAR